MRFDVQKNVNPHFRDVWKTKAPYNVLKGGRNSFKSSVIALLCVYIMLRYIRIGERANVVVIRKVGNTIRDSVFNKIKWALRMFGVIDGFTDTVSPFKVKHKKTGSTFYFYGQDDFKKLKSNDIEDIVAVWYEEAAEFTNAEEFDQTNITFMRQKHRLAPFVRFFWSYNPPRNPYAWINGWYEEKKTDPRYLCHSSTYLDDKLGFVTEQMLEDIERVKANDFDYYRYIYLGEAVGLGNNVYNMTTFHALDQLKPDDPLVGVAFALDGGHMQSATACLALGVTAKANVVLLDTYYYSPAGQVNKKAPSQLSQDVRDFTRRIVERHRVQVIQYTIDSAEGALRNQFFLDWGVRWNPVAKAKNSTMIEVVQSLLARGRFYYLDTPENAVFISEHQRYRYDKKTLQTDDPRVIKEDDHTCDAFKYFCLDNAKLLGLMV